MEYLTTTNITIYILLSLLLAYIFAKGDNHINKTTYARGAFYLLTFFILIPVIGQFILMLGLFSYIIHRKGEKGNLYKFFTKDIIK